MVFQQKLLGESLFFFTAKMSGPAMVRSASYSDASNYYIALQFMKFISAFFDFREELLTK